MERFENIWISSDDHLNSFKEVRKNKKILKTVQNLNSDNKLYDFPRKNINGNMVPLVFENKGKLIISDDSLQIYLNSAGIDDQYYGINKGENLFLSYNQIKSINLYRPKISFLKYFNISWIKLEFDINAKTKSILLSNSGQGFVMKRIKKKNIELLKIIENKLK